MPIISQFKQWRNGETFNARDYVYERDTIVNQLNRLSTLVGDGETSDTSITVAGLTATGTLSATTVTASGSISAGDDISAGGNLTVTGSVTGNSLTVNSITMGGDTITDFADTGTLTTLSTSEPQSSDGEDGQVWIEYSE